MKITYLKSYEFPHILSCPGGNYPFEICAYEKSQENIFENYLKEISHIQDRHINNKSEKQFLEIICKKFHTFYAALNDQVNLLNLICMNFHMFCPDLNENVC